MTASIDAVRASPAPDPCRAGGVRAPIVRLLGIEKYFGSNHVLRGCNLEVYPSETICLIGRSG